VAFALIGGDCSDPAAALFPAHAPEAVQPVPFELHVRVVRAPLATSVGLAENVKVVDPGTVTVAVRDVVPPAPVHDNVNVVVAAIGLTF
jgi:hypothetical protein